jgi:hypothetical protein
VRVRKVAIPKKGSRITMSTTKDFRKVRNASTVSPRFHYRGIRGIGKELNGFFYKKYPGGGLQCPGWKRWERFSAVRSAVTWWK